MTISGKGLDVLSMLESFSARSLKLSDDGYRLVGLAQDRGLVSVDPTTHAVTVLVSDEEISSIPAFSDMNGTELSYLISVIVGTLIAASQPNFNGRTSSDILRKWGGNALIGG
jgi:hypothetical protein